MSIETVRVIESKIDNILTMMDVFPQQYRWCREQFGPEGPRWTARVTPYEFEFANEEDKLLFMLRWL